MRPMHRSLSLGLLAVLASGPSRAQTRQTGQIAPARMTQAQNAALPVGWHDEMNTPEDWQPLALDNKPDVLVARRGALILRLPHVPQGFPYAYQWSGVTRAVSVNLGRYPVLVARVRRLDKNTYAHLDVEERDDAGKVVRTARSSTLYEPGMSVLDFGTAWGTDTRRLTLRLIVGGSLSGVACEYDWVRFVRREDLPFLQSRPNWQRVVAPEGEPVRAVHKM